MKIKLLTFVLLFWTATSFAGLDSNVLIDGRIHSFDKTSARVIDEHGQIFNLAKTYFPKGFVFQTDKTFMLEMPFEEFEKLTIKRLPAKK